MINDMQWHCHKGYEKQKLHNRERRHTLATPRFTHDSQRPILLNREVDAINGNNTPVVGFESGLEVGYF